MLPRSLAFFLLLKVPQNGTFVLYLLKHKGKFHTIFWDVFCVQEAVELEVELPVHLSSFSSGSKPARMCEEGERDEICEIKLLSKLTPEESKQGISEFCFVTPAIHLVLLTGANCFQQYT